MTGEQRGKKWSGNGKSASRELARDSRFEQRREARRQRKAVNLEQLYLKEWQELLEFCLNVGGAVRIRVSRDGGAWAVGIYGFGEPFTEYCGGDEDLAEFLASLLGDLRDVDPTG